jgi:hypothetical protein
MVGCQMKKDDHKKGGRDVDTSTPAPQRGFVS